MDSLVGIDGAAPGNDTVFALDASRSLSLGDALVYRDGTFTGFDVAQWHGDDFSRLAVVDLPLGPGRRLREGQWTEFAWGRDASDDFRGIDVASTRFVRTSTSASAPSTPHGPIQMAQASPTRW